MSIFDQLNNNKGTVSSQLGKDLAKKVLKGDSEILKEAVVLCCHDLTNVKGKSIRAGAAKIVEMTAREQPDLVAPYLEQLLPALEADEPQTRWMVIRILGLCAKGNPEAAAKGLDFAKYFIRQKKAGQLCLVSATDLYLGDFGALSKKNAKTVYPILMESCDNVILNEHDWLLEAFMNIIPLLSDKEKGEILSFAEEYADHSRKKTLERIKKIRTMCGIK